MSDHFDTDDSRTDLTDLYIFPSSETADHTVLIVDFNPEANVDEVSFDPLASYEIKIDTDGDFEADVAFHFQFETPSSGLSTATVYRATGGAARATGVVGDAMVVAAAVPADGFGDVTAANGYRFFAGLRSDPHFKDIKGFRNNFQFTGDDPVARRNVFGIALEVPNEALGGTVVRIWARAVTVVDGLVKVVDQAGRPGVNNAFNGPEEDRLEFDETPPVEQRQRFRDRFVAFLSSLGYPPDEAHKLADSYLPDVLEYRVSAPAGYPNGRRLTDDTADLLAGLLTRGRVTSDLAGPHTDLLDVFPYLGPPHPQGVAATHTV
jgi:hypothetical protein